MNLLNPDYAVATYCIIWVKTKRSVAVHQNKDETLEREKILSK
jgi:hypothetical protein